jgi:hypothetical protein
MLRHCSSLSRESWVKAGVAAALLVAAAVTAPGAARAGEDPFPLICANRDLDVVTLIELHGGLQFIAPARLAEAYFTVMDARNLCSEGKIDAALKLYNTTFMALYEEGLLQQNKVAGR